MGLDDREYMRERRRNEIRARSGNASWITGQQRFGQEAPWSSQFKPHTAQRWILLLSALTILIPSYGEVQKRGWIPDFEESEPFPETGSVTVTRSIKPRDVTSSLTVVTSRANAVVQFVDPRTDVHILSVFVAGQNRITVPAPVGTFRMRFIEGRNWHGRKRYFGPSTSYETGAELMTFEARTGHLIDLNRRPGGNLKTRTMMKGPAPI